jgi:hypothetical protein
MATKTLRVSFSRSPFGTDSTRFRADTYTLASAWSPKLCAGEVRKFVDLPTENHFDLVMTTKKPKGSNFHTLKVRPGSYEYYLANVKIATRPEFYKEFIDMLRVEFGRRTVYAWVEA